MITILPYIIMGVSLVIFLGFLRPIIRHGQPLGQPSCRQCGYVIQGLSRPVCPECGMNLEADGVRINRYKASGFMLALCLAALFPFIFLGTLLVAHLLGESYSGETEVEFVIVSQQDIYSSGSASGSAPRSATEKTLIISNHWDIIKPFWRSTDIDPYGHYTLYYKIEGEIAAQLSLSSNEVQADTLQDDLEVWFSQSLHGDGDFSDDDMAIIVKAIRQEQRQFESPNQGSRLGGWPTTSTSAQTGLHPISWILALILIAGQSSVAAIYLYRIRSKRQSESFRPISEVWRNATAN